MNRTPALLATIALLVAAVALPVAGMAADPTSTPGHAPQSGTPTSASNGSAEAAAPGAVFAAAVDVQEAEVESELEGRVFGIKVARANSNASKASVVAQEVNQLERRTETLRERKQTLMGARENGTISETRYRAEMAALAARTEAIQRQLDRTQATTNDLPADLLESKGVNATAIETLRNDSRDLSGPNTADIAGSIAGPGRGDGPAGGNDSPGLPGTVPARNGTGNDTNRSGVLPGTDGFDTPTLPGSPGLPGNGTGPPGDGPGTPTTGNGGLGEGIGDGVDDVLSPILGGSGGDETTETATPTGSGTPTGSDTPTATDTETTTDDSDAEETDSNGLLG